MVDKIRLTVISFRMEITLFFSQFLGKHFYMKIFHRWYILDFDCYYHL